MEFRCRLGTAGGEVIEGVYVADSEARLRRDLEEKGLFVLSLRPRRLLGGLSLRKAGGSRINRREFIVFNQELATLLKAGMPLVQSLDILRQRVTDGAFRTVLDDVYEQVKAGTSMSEAFSARGQLVPPVYAASLMAGERSGSLDEVLRRYVAYEKVIGAVRRRTLSALIYPSLLTAMMAVLVGIIVLRVIPAFSTFYQNFDRELPLSTRVIVGISNTLVGNFWLILAVLAAAVIGFVTWARSSGQRVKVDHFLLKLPWAGPTIRKFATAQMARTLGTLLGGGIPLVHALQVVVGAMSNRYLARQLEYVEQAVREGQSLASALLARGEFPDVAVKMVEVGESTGALQEMLNSLADFYDEEIETEVGRFITLVEPVLLVIMGVLIAAVVIALYLPLFELSSVVGGA
jgi:type IV pilus assembly protein PilC